MLTRFKSIDKSEKVIKGRDTVVTPLRIIGKLVNEESTVIVSKIINKISISLLEYLQYYYKEDIPDIEQMKKLKDEAINLFQTIKNYTNEVWKAFTSKLALQIRDMNKIDQELENPLKTIDLINFYLGEEHLSIRPDEETMEIDECAEIVSTLLKGLEKFEDSMPVLELIERLLSYLANSGTQARLTESVRYFNTFFSSMTKIAREISEPQMMSTFKKCSQIIIKIQIKNHESEGTEKPDWLLNVINVACRREHNP